MNTNIGTNDRIAPDQTIPRRGQLEDVMARKRGGTISKLTDEEVRDIAVEALANSFLKVPDDFAEDRVAILETVIPKLVPAMEKLLREISKADAGIVKTNKSSASMYSPDLPAQYPTNPVDYLAQMLYRSKLVITHKTSQDIVYTKGLENVTLKLKDRIKQVELERRIAAAKALEKAQYERQVKAQKRHDLFNQNLTSIYDKWTSALWRTQPPYLFETEWIEFMSHLYEFESLSHSKIKALISNIQRSDVKPTANDPFAIGSNRYFDKPNFVDICYKSMLIWTEDELKYFVEIADSYIARVRDELRKNFAAKFYIPRFNDLLPGSDEWRRSMAKFCAVYKAQDFDEEIRRDLRCFLEASKNTAIDTSFENILCGICTKFGLKAFENLIESLHAFDVERKALFNEIVPEEFPSSAPTTATTTSQPAAKLPVSLRVPKIVEVFEQIKTEQGVSLKLVDTFIEAVLKTDINVAQKSGLTNMRSLSQENNGFIPFETFIAHQDKSLKALSNDDFGSVLSAIKLAIKNELQRQETEEKGKKRTSALKALSQVAENIEPGLHALGTSFLNILTHGLSQVHNLSQVAGRISIPDHSVTKITCKGEHVSLAESALKDHTAVKCIALSENIKDEAVVGAILTDQVDNSVLKSDGLMIVADLRSSFPGDILIPKQNVAANTIQSINSSSLLYIGIPLKPDQEKADVSGVLSLTLGGAQSDLLSSEDHAFLNRAAGMLAKAIMNIHKRVQLSELVASICEYVSSVDDPCTVDIFLPEEHGAYYYKFSKSTPEGQANLSDINSPSPQLETLADLPTQEGEYVTQAFQEGALIELLEKGTRNTVYLPVKDEESTEGKVTAILKMQAKKGSEISNSKLKTVQNLLPSIYASFNKAQKMKVRPKPEVRESTLDIEFLDDKTRNQLLFAKTLYGNAREKVSNLDAALFAELRSYREPPKLIRVVLKGVLYIFGHKPRELKDWKVMSKHINKELLQKMTKYDPTTVQKKIRFKRLKRVLDLLKNYEVSKRGSIPAQVMHEWLLVAYDLRQRAVQARMRRVDVFSLSDLASLENSSTPGEQESDDEAEADGNEGALPSS